MALPIEGTAVVVRNAAIEKKVAGGLDGFGPVVPNATGITDDHIYRVGFMSEVDAEQFGRELSHYGLEQPEDFVIVRSYMPAEEQVLPWLSVGKWDKATIAWLKGTEPRTVTAPEGWDPSAEPLEHWSADEVEENLEYLRSEDGVEVYLDKRTGKELYSARTKSQAERLFDEASDLARPFLKYHDKESKEGEGVTELNRAIEILEQAVDLEPEYWAARFYLGKCWQALKEPDKALKVFRETADFCGDRNADVWREYMLECLNAGLAAEGVAAAERAIAIEPDNDGLMSNRALAYLIAGDLKEARIAVKKARKMNRRDPVTKALQRVIREIQKGKRKQPSNLRELQG